MWRQTDSYVVSMNGADHESVDEIHDKVRHGGQPWFAVSPLMHAAGMWTAFAALLNGLPVVLYDRTKFDPPAVLETAEREKVGMMTMVGDAYAGPLVEELRQGSYDLSSLFAIGTGGAATNPKHQRALLELLPQITLINGYGSSETGNMGFGRSQRGTQKDTFELRDGASGGVRGLQPIPAARRAGDRLGRARRAGSRLGYFDDPVATRKTFPVVEGQRVVISGDRGSLASDGTLRLFGRDSLVVNTGGEKVFVEEVEEVLRAHPAIADALVVGRPSERWGQEVVALVALRDGADAGPRAAARRTARRSWRASRRRRSSSSSSRSVGWATARPTTGGRKAQRHNRQPLTVTMTASKAIDCLVNVHFGETEKQPDLDAQGARRLLQGSGVDVRAGRPGRAARRDGRAGRREGHPDGQPRQAVGDRAQVRRSASRTGSRWRWAASTCCGRCRRCGNSTAVVADLPVAYAVVGPELLG